VTNCGRICYKRRKVNLSQVFAGKTSAFATFGLKGFSIGSSPTGLIVEVAQVVETSVDLRELCGLGGRLRKAWKSSEAQRHTPCVDRPGPIEVGVAAGLE